MRREGRNENGRDGMSMRMQGGKKQKRRSRQELPSLVSRPAVSFFTLSSFISTHSRYSCLQKVRVAGRRQEGAHERLPPCASLSALIWPDGKRILYHGPSSLGSLAHASQVSWLNLIDIPHSREGPFFSFFIYFGGADLSSEQSSRRPH